jgi:transposase
MPTKKYTPEFKSSIVALYNEGSSANSLTNEYHLAVKMVNGWVKKAKIVGTDANDKPVTLNEFNAMQKEIARLREEKGILKLAAVLLGEYRK